MILTFDEYCAFPKAKRVGVNCVILPEENKKDYNDLPKYITDGLEVHFASTFADVYHVCFTEAQESGALHSHNSADLNIPTPQAAPLLGKSDNYTA